MAGLIRRADIDEVRERTDIKEIVEEYVSLKSAGIGSYKGLCPFHDERTPSFHVRPQMGSYHCFGCGESGDVIAFLMQMNSTSFAETVEYLAGRVGVTLHYEDGGSGPTKEQVGRRQRLLDAHKVAEEFFRKQLQTPEAQTAREELTSRGFTAEHAEQFGVGYAPQGWDNLLRFLRNNGFTEDELKETGMFSEGQRGIYDRFRGRLIWPIRDLTGATIGFGARKLYEDDQGPKYLNTPETAIYKKSQVLYGVDLARREIAKKKQLVVVEGYTDVMACHLAGITTAVATCGTAFGADHIKVARRLLSDFGSGGEVIFTFDGDEAGQKAALRAFREDQRFVAQTFIAVGPDGMDPCDVRQKRGDEALRDVLNHKTPLFEFALKAELKQHNLETVEGRVAAMRAAAPIIASMRDSAMRPAYIREVAGWLGMEVGEVRRAVAQSGRGGQSRRGGQPGRAGQYGVGQYGQGQGAGRSSVNAPVHGFSGEAAGPVIPAGVNLTDPATKIEWDALEVVIQNPHLIDADAWAQFFEAKFLTPAHAAIKDAIVVAATMQVSTAVWVETIREQVPEPLAALVSQMAVAPLPASNEEELRRYCKGIVNRLLAMQINRQKADYAAELQRVGSDDPERVEQLHRKLMELEMQRRRYQSEAL
ncbi:DNA primase [Pseudoglutamicibacter cumminsii]|uniref:DNA primase n=1 Tax=Pseudoglutamicibacter cumminsii TaxID=156979 RepID=A0AAP4FEL7_9MICC|nr:DNA primase [Pseudoglutamicibacter cumminsii]MDK6274963.1 DNA primase [Pseudoglutamicibacter cumminsii]